MNHQQKNKLNHLKSEADLAKKQLIRLLDEVLSVSPSQAKKLETIISKLEAWQQS